MKGDGADTTKGNWQIGGKTAEKMDLFLLFLGENRQDLDDKLF